MRTATSSLLGFLLMSAVPCTANSQYPLRLDSMRVVGREAEIGQVVAAKVGPDGSVYVLDHLKVQLLKFSPTGRLLWRAGRKGGGPGEFQQPYRLDVHPDGSVYVFDLQESAITRFSSDGRYLARHRLPFQIRQLDNLVIFADGTMLLAGTTDANERASRSALHRFAVRGQELSYLGSFGPLPQVKDREVQLRWGAGAITRGTGGDVLYLRRIPYEIYRYDISGRQKSVLRLPFRTRGTPDDAIGVQRTARSTTFSSMDTDVDRPGVAWELDRGWILSTRTQGETRRWDMFAPDGRFAGTRTAPEGWEMIVGFDPARSVLWVTGTQDDEPVLLRVSVSLGVR